MILSCYSMKNLLFTIACTALLATGFFPTLWVDGNTHGNDALLETKTSNDKISVELYYESQCPGCREVLTGSFYQAFLAVGFLEMADVTLVPYGNAKETGGPTATAITARGTVAYAFECQHGESECVYNTIEACALDKIQKDNDNNQYVTFSYIDCIERHDESRDPKQDYSKVALFCGRLAGLRDEVVQKIATCSATDSEEGNQLVHELAAKTESLDPPHTYVPWIVVDGVHNDDIQDKVSTGLLDYVCSKYKGPNKSPDCPPPSSIETKTTTTTTKPHLHLHLRSDSGNSSRNVCYYGDGDDGDGDAGNAFTVAKE